MITIVAVANTIFWLKDVDPRFREGEDSNFNDVPTLVEHKLRLAAMGKVNYHHSQLIKRWGYTMDLDCFFTNLP